MCTRFWTSHSSIVFVKEPIKSRRKKVFRKNKKDNQVISRIISCTFLALKFCQRSQRWKEALRRSSESVSSSCKLSTWSLERSASNTFCFCERRTVFSNLSWSLSFAFQKHFLVSKRHSSVSKKHLPVNVQEVICSEFCTHLSVFLLCGANFWTRYYRFRSRSKQTTKRLGKMRLYPTGKSKSSRQSNQSWIGVDRREPVRLLRASGNTVRLLRASSDRKSQTYV